jgi:glutathione S-transferase
MNQKSLPILYSFRRCPYAMRARLALKSSKIVCELREVVLRDKPADMIAASPKATVPVLIDRDGTVVDESLDVMLWALRQNDPHEYLQPELGTEQDMLEMISRIDGPFKQNLDAYKYAPRNAEPDSSIGVERDQHRDAAMACLTELEEKLNKSEFLFGNRIALADIAIAPFVRQFANVDLEWFQSQPFPKLIAWLEIFVSSDNFAACMNKYDKWVAPESGIPFPEQQA